MSLTGNNIIAGASGQTTGYDIDQSLRFNRPDAPYLEKTFSASNRKTWTWSGWFKLADPSVADGSVGHRRFFGTNTGNSDSTTFELGINTDNKLIATGWNNNFRITTAVYRDPSSWYHVVYVFDSTDSTADDRLKMYVNGEQITSFTNSYTVTQDADYGVNQSGAHYVGYGGSGAGNAYCMDGYLAEIHFIDGQALTPASFGETNEDTNQWQAIEYAGSYGTNGFYQKYQDSSALGDDSSGNTNDFTATNLAATDQVIDSPTNNFCTINPLASFSATLTEGNLKVTGGNDMSATFGVFSGKWYWELTSADLAGGSGNGIMGGIYSGFGLGSGSGIYDTQDDIACGPVSSNYFTFAKGYSISSISSNLGTQVNWANNDIISFQLDLDSTPATIKAYINNGGTPTMSHTFTYDGSYPVYPYIRCNSGYSGTWNWGQDSSFSGLKTAQGNGGVGEDFYYTPPTGFKALNTDNLDDPAIALPEDHFKTVLYTGDGTTSHVITTGLQPDLVWTKERPSSTGNHNVYDSVRGASKSIYPNLTTAEQTSTGTQDLYSFNSTGFTIGTNYNALINTSGEANVSWNWKAGGTASTNEEGSIDSEVSANPTAGFSIVKWTGSEASATIGHGLSQAPELIIVKDYDTAGRVWPVNVTNITGTANQYLILNATDAVADSAAYWGAAPGASTFTVGDSGTTNGSGSVIAYCFHSVDGYSKIGKFVGGGSNDAGTFIYTGFRPAYLLVKSSSNAGNEWFIFDSKINPANTIRQYYLQAQSTAAQVYTNESNSPLDFVSNGIKFRWTQFNPSGYDMIYMAFAESPFKTSNAR